MTYDVSVTVNVECDRCPHTDSLDFDEPTSESEIDDYLEGEGWKWVDGELLCPECASKSQPEREFLDDCDRCTRHLDRRRGFDNLIYCPHRKKNCSEVFDELYLESDDGCPKCPDYLPIGGIKTGPPQYKPTTASLEGFVEGFSGKKEGEA